MKERTLLIILFAAVLSVSACDLTLSNKLYNLSNPTGNVLVKVKSLFEMNDAYNASYTFSVNGDKISIIYTADFNSYSGSSDLTLYTVSTNGVLESTIPLTGFSVSGNGMGASANVLNKESVVVNGILFFFDYDKLKVFDTASLTQLKVVDNLNACYIYDNSYIYLVSNTNVIYRYTTDSNLTLVTCFTDTGTTLYGSYTPDIAASSDSIYFMKNYKDFDVNECRKFNLTGTFQLSSTNLSTVHDTYEGSVISMWTIGSYTIDNAVYDIFDSSFNESLSTRFPSAKVDGDYEIDFYSASFLSGGKVYVSASSGSKFRIYLYNLDLTQE